MAQLELWMHWLVEFMRANQEWAIPIVFLVAFCECVAFLSWLVPATVFFTAFGAVAGASGLNLDSALTGGDGGRRHRLLAVLLGGTDARARASATSGRSTRTRSCSTAGHAFFEKWGFASILIGHFFGPMRAVIAIVAGIVNMPFVSFQIANWLASAAWAFSLLYGSGRLAEMLSR